jgi:predicted Zn-dependent protease
MAPYDAISHQGLSWVMREAGEDDEALEWAKFAVTHDPNMYEFYFNALTKAYRAAGKWPEGVTFGETQIIKDPVHAKWWYDFLGFAYAATGQQDKAAEAFKKSRASPDPPQSCPAG